MPMSEPTPSPHALRVSDLPRKRSRDFALRPDAEELTALARGLDLSALRKVSFTGTVAPLGTADWQLTARLGATMVQPCAVTLEPVTTRIDTDVTRRYLAEYVEIEGAEVEMPEDDTQEPLSRWIDPQAVMEEALALSVPLYPRAEGAELGEMVHTEPGKEPLRDEDTKPFAGLADLRAALAKGSEGPKGDG
jgi:uncharacterized metal-binding protein YceD (DUF177 family)